MSTDLDRQLHASVMKREEEKEREFREARAAREEEFMLGVGATSMSQKELRKVIDADRRMYYRTEELNDKLYIHYKGWKAIENLEGWTGLRAFYAECNAFSEIQGLTKCRSLRSLFLQENCIKKIQGLEGCPDLWNINLSNNFIEKIEGLSSLKNLNTLQIAKNKIGLKGVDDLIELAGHPSLGTLDIQDNRIWDPDVLPEVFMRIPNLRVLYMKGNEAAKRIPNYRKSTTVYCKDLKYLDDRPVFPEDRRAAEAFNRGGLEAERAERRLIKQEERDRHDRNMKAFGEMIQDARDRKRETESMRAEDKYSDETDVVESMERRNKRMTDKWYVDNAEDLKDENLERAKRCLAAERDLTLKAREEAANQNKDPNSNEVSTRPSTAASCRFDEDELDAELGSDKDMPHVDERAGGFDAEVTAAHQFDPNWRPEDSKLEQEEPMIQDAEPDPCEVRKMTDYEKSQKENEKKVDKRKLVYEDIWDDVSPGSTVRACSSGDRGGSGGGRLSAEESPVSDAQYQEDIMKEISKGMASVGGSEVEQKESILRACAAGKQMMNKLMEEEGADALMAKFGMSENSDALGELLGGPGPSKPTPAKAKAAAAPNTSSMDDVVPDAETLRRQALMRAAAAARGDAGAPGEDREPASSSQGGAQAGEKPAWVSKYAEKLQEQGGAAAAGAASGPGRGFGAFKPPPRGLAAECQRLEGQGAGKTSEASTASPSASPAAQPTAELEEMD